MKNVRLCDTKMSAFSRWIDQTSKMHECHCQTSRRQSELMAFAARLNNKNKYLKRMQERRGFFSAQSVILRQFYTLRTTLVSMSRIADIDSGLEYLLWHAQNQHWYLITACLPKSFVWLSLSLSAACPLAFIKYECAENSDLTKNKSEFASL